MRGWVGGWVTPGGRFHAAPQDLHSIWPAVQPGNPQGSTWPQRNGAANTSKHCSSLQAGVVFPVRVHHSKSAQHRLHAVGVVSLNCFVVWGEDTARLLHVHIHPCVVPAAPASACGRGIQEPAQALNALGPDLQQKLAPNRAPLSSARCHPTEHRDPPMSCSRSQPTQYGGSPMSCSPLSSAMAAG